MAPQLYVYYRVRATHLGAAVAAVRGLHATWCAQQPGLQCELMQRADESAGAVTLMEVYRGPEGISPAWQQRIEREAGQALARWLDGERHREVFAPCA